MEDNIIENKLDINFLMLRLGAFIVDHAVIFILAWIISKLVLGYFSLNILDGVEASTINFRIKIFAFFFMYFIYTLMECSRLQATIGKLLFGLKIVDLNLKKISFSKSINRNFWKIISGAAYCLGYISIFFTKENQGLHNSFSKTLVVKKR